ncbi:MAG: hypothetical protein CVV49_11200 [Spirochaetae bacterium HGW-Spirochaetae-5]|nr:MAG: hypothetical protein CVV49_11200 [Spirochaetae bacterium HGW-Spirochaetae-5]
MKSKGVFIFLGIFGLAVALLLSMGIDVVIIFLFSGISMIILGIYLLKKEFEWRRNSDLVPGKVTCYHNHQQSVMNGAEGISTMYTMEAEYITKTGKLVIAREQSSSTSKKYREGQALMIRYNREDPKLFIVEGDNSRIYAMIGVMIMGAVIAALFAYIFINGIQIDA